MISATLLSIIAAATAGLPFGIMLGWMLHMLRSRQQKQQSPSQNQSVPDIAALDNHIEQLRAIANSKRQSIEETRIMLNDMERYLTTLNKDITTLREQVSNKEGERSRLQSTLNDAHGSLQSVEASLQSHEKETESLLSNIDKSLEEIDMLNELHETYLIKLNRLTQQVQWHDSELRMLQQTAQTKSAEIEEARALVEQRDAELRRIIRQRQQREIDLEHVKQTLAQRDEELRQLLRQQAQAETVRRSTHQIESQSKEDRIVLPPRKQHPQLPSPIPTKQSDSASLINEQDDLTQISGLAEFYAVQLHAHGIRTFRQLANARPEDIQRMLDIPGHFSPNISRWIEAAQKRTNNNSAEKKEGY